MAAIRLCLITDRTALGAGGAALDALVALARDASDAGIDLVQVREKDLTARELLSLTRRILGAVGPATEVVVNDRFDVAIAVGAAGVHLTTTSVPTGIVRCAVGEDLLIGVSTHSHAEVSAAAAAGADYVVCGPAFTTPSKAGFGAPMGPAELQRIAGDVDIPLLALGGVDESSVSNVFRGRVAGIAAIRMFQDTWISGGRKALAALVTRIRSSS